MTTRIFIRPVKRTRTNAVKERNSTFLCPSNTVLTGRYHSGDENGYTQYEYATLGAFDENGNTVSGTIAVINVKWKEGLKEPSGAGFDAAGNQVLVGRQHSGDETGQTIYATGIITFNGKEASTQNRQSSSSFKESDGVWCCSNAKSVMTGRHHTGDENGYTYYNFSEVCVIQASSEPAPEGTVIVPDKRTFSATQVESASSFLCPNNCVLTGRMHRGDENGNTTYQYATLKAISPKGIVIDGEITVQGITWSKGIKESEGIGFDAPEGKVIVGRSHTGDENGETRYAVGLVYFNGHPTTIKDYHISAPMKENAGTSFITNSQSVITARHHYGDENGTTYYGYGTISCDAKELPKEPVIINVQMHSEDTFFPMNPADFVRLSRVRRHNKGKADDGYSKRTGGFVKGNDDHTPEYYDIPLAKMKSFRPDEEYALMNLRAYDDNSLKSGELFLQTDDHLHGDSNPNKRVPCMKYKLSDKKIQYWLFFGYNESPGAVFSHQGDWECVTIELDNDNKIKKVSLSAHDGDNTYEASQLKIRPGSKNELTIYCAKGTHALYADVGDHPRTIINAGVKIKVDDPTDAKGYKWRITDNVLDLKDKNLLWKYFAGSWGEIGMFNFTTGPLGPWYKCPGLDLEICEHNSPAVSSLIKEGQILLIRDKDKDKRKTVIISNETNSEAVADDNKMLDYRQHEKDENGQTTYGFTSLKAIDFKGKGIAGIEITITDRKWDKTGAKQSESGNYFLTSDMDDPDKESRVITGRKHNGDENGMTYYETGVVRCNGKKVKVVRYPKADLKLYESRGKLAYPKENLIIMGILHTGDENGVSTYCQGYIIAEL